MTRPLTQTIRTLIASLSPRRRAQLLLLVGLMLAGAVAEVVSLGAILPFLAVLVDPVQALRTPLVGRLVNTLGLSISDDLRWQLTLLFATATVAAGAMRFALIYGTAKLNFAIGHELGSEIYRRTLYQPYEVHVARNSSEIMGGLRKVDQAVWVLFGLLNLVSASVIAICIVTVLLLIDPVLAMAALLGLGTIYAVVSTITRKRIARNSQIIGPAFNMQVQTVQEGLGSIRDVLLDQVQPLFVRRFNQVDWPLRQAQASINIVGPGPRFAVEALGMVVIALLAYYLTTSGDGVAAAIPALGALALGAQRLMPLIQQIYQGSVQALGSRDVMHDVVNLLTQPIAEETQMPLNRLPFEREIRLDRVSFRFQSHLPLVIQELNLAIPKGARVGFIGTTGSGKSTVIDLIMGLLQPTEGQIRVDDKPLVGVSRLAWQRNIAHVPQAIFLADASFTENIAFGVPSEKIDLARVRHTASQAQIADFIATAPLGYETTIGERGVRLSGGQRQRIGIARALYKQASVLIFDEATSALDGETETAVMQAVARLGRDLTILLIAHRLTTLQGCDVIYRLDEGKIVGSGSYEAMLVAQRADFPTEKVDVS